MANIALGRSQGNAAQGRTSEDFGEAFDLDDVADLGACAVGFDHGSRGRIESGVFPGTSCGQYLADGIGGGDALTLAIAGAAYTADHGVDLVAVALGVSQTLEQKGSGAFAHDEAVGAVAKGPAAGCAESADLAELNEDACAHVAVHAAGNHRVDSPLDQQLHRGVDGRKAGSAGGIGDEAGAAQVEHVGDPARNDVGQLTGHGILGDFRQFPFEAFFNLRHDGGSHRSGQL